MFWNFVVYSVERTKRREQWCFVVWILDVDLKRLAALSFLSELKLELTFFVRCLTASLICLFVGAIQRC